MHSLWTSIRRISGATCASVLGSVPVPHCCRGPLGFHESLVNISTLYSFSLHQRNQAGRARELRWGRRPALAAVPAVPQHGLCRDSRPAASRRAPRADGPMQRGWAAARSPRSPPAPSGLLGAVVLNWPLWFLVRQPQGIASGPHGQQYRPYSEPQCQLPGLIGLVPMQSDDRCSFGRVHASPSDNGG